MLEMTLNVILPPIDENLARNQFEIHAESK
jgi:hypothetical protein